MSILDTFYILFKTDGDKAAEEIKDVDRAADAAERSLKRTDMAAAAMGQSFLRMALTAAAPLAALASFGGALAVVQNRIEEIGTISDDALKLRSSPQDYDAFTRAVRAAGGEMAAAQANLGTFAEKLNDAAARASGPNAKNFAKWGIVFRDAGGEAVGAVDGILSLAKSLETVSRAEALGRLKKLGIEDADTIDFLLQGKKAIVERMDAEKAAGVVTDRQIELEGRYQSAVGKTRNMLDSVAGAITEKVLPWMIKAYEGFNKFFGWMLKNQRLVEGFFGSIATVITAAYLPAIIRAAWWTAAALWPYISLIAVIGLVAAAFALAYEDVRAFMDGQPSLIGELASKYEWFGNIVKDLQGIFGDLKSAVAWLSSTDAGVLKEIADTLLGLSGLEASALAIGALTLALSPLARTLFLFALAFSAAKTGIDYLSSLKTDMDLKVAQSVTVENPRTQPGYVESAGYDDQGEFIYMKGAARVDRPAENPQEGFTGDALDYKMQLIQEEGAAVEKDLKNAQSLLNQASSTPINGQTSKSIEANTTNNNTTHVAVGGVTVNTQATDAQGVASAVKGELQRQLRSTSAQFDDGVDR